MTKRPTTFACSRCFAGWSDDLTRAIVPRHLRRMTSLLSGLNRSGLAAILAVVVSLPLAGQVSVQVSAGVTRSGTLVTDGVLLTKLRPGIAPTIGAAIAVPTGKGPFRLRLQVDYSRSELEATANGSTDKLGSLATIDALVMAEGRLTPAFRWQVGGGAIFYRPSENEGVFYDGPTRRWMIAGALSYWHQLSRNLILVVNGRIDSHSFKTETLQQRNYAGSQGVQRFALQLGIERAF
jgi:hypothetical protein